MVQGAPLNESDHCGDPPLLLAAGNGASSEDLVQLHNIRRLPYDLLA